MRRKRPSSPPRGATRMTAQPHLSKSTIQLRDEAFGGEEVVGPPVVSGADASEVLSRQKAFSMWYRYLTCRACCQS